MNDFIPKTGSIGKTALVNQDAKQNKPTPKGDGAFDQILTRHIKENSATEPSNNSSALPEIQSPVGNPFISKVSPDLETAKYAQKIETSLDLLETYAAFLDNPGKTLKQANNILEQVLQQTQAMALEFETTPPKDPDLMQILTQLISTAEVEKIKFDRGDYSS